MLLHLRSVNMVIIAAAMCILSLGRADAAKLLPGSTISFAGQSSCSATSCTFGSVFVTGGTGSFSNFAFNTPATFFPLAITPFTPQQVYTTTNAMAQTATFFATARLSQMIQTVDTLKTFTVNNAGISHLTGYDDAMGALAFSANQDGVLLGSFSATSNGVSPSVPEPATWALMIAGFGMIGFATRRRLSTRTRPRFV